MTIRPGYKQTEVGIIPVDWTVYLLPATAKFRNGKAHENYIVDVGNYVCVNSKFISSDGKVKKFSSASFCSAKKGDVMLVMSDLPNGKALAKAFLADKDDYYAVNQRVCTLTARSNTSPGYLYYTLNRNPYFLKFDDGVSQTHLLNPAFEACPVPLPPNKAEQEAIAEALSEADALIESLEQLIAKKRQIKQGAMQQLLTGRKRLPGFGDDWQLKSVGQLLTIRHGKSQKDVETESSQYPVLGTSGVIGYSSRPLYEKPSVLIGRKGTIDRPQYIDTPFWSVDTLFYSHILDDNNAKYLFYRFWLINWKQYNEASGVPSLNAKTIESIEIIMPPAEEQTAIAQILSDMDAEITELETKLAKARQVKQGMMQQLLTGRIRLVEPQRQPIAEADAAAI